MPNIIARTGLLAFCLMLIFNPLEARAASPTETIRSMADEVVNILSDPAYQDPARKPQLRQRVRQAVDRRFDYEEMAKRSLGPTWGRLNATQRREFTRLFSQLLEATYAERLETYTGEQVRYLSETRDDGFAEVRTVLMRRDDRIPMNYRLINKPPWVVYDVVIEGVSLVSNYRSQFQRVISETSYAELVRRLRTRVEALQ
jgi:phospholipid transport system substrate-binding protein